MNAQRKPQRFRYRHDFTQSKDASFDAGEVRRYLRLARLAERPREVSQLIAQAKHHARAAWHVALAKETEALR